MNEAQNSKLAAHREVLVQRKEEVTYMDKRIAELQARLRKKKAQQKEAANRDQQQQQQHQDSVYNLANQMRSHSTKLGPRAMSTNVAAVEPYIQRKEPKDTVEAENFGPGKGDPKYQSLPYSIKFAAGESNGKDPGGTGLEKILAEDGMRPDAARIPDKVPPEKADLSDISRGGKLTEFKPASSHSSGYSLPDVSLKPSDSSAPANRSVYGAGYKPGISNFAPRPYGTTFSTSMLVNRPVVTTSSVHLSPPAGSISSPGAGYPKTSTPIAGQSQEHKGQSPEGKAEGQEIFITGAPPSQPYSTSATSSHYLPPSSSAPPPPASCASYSQSSGQLPAGGGRYQIASSRPHLPPAPQHTLPPPSPLSTSAPTSSATHRPTYPPTSRPTLPPPPPPQFSQREESSTDFREKSPVQEPSPEPSSQSTVSQPQPIPGRSRDSPEDPDNKLDISSTSVNSALSVLKAGSPPGPKASYRYAPKSVIANTYLKKLGSSNLDQYKQNMNDLYRNFITSQTFSDENKDQPTNSEDTSSQLSHQGSSSQLTVLPAGEQSGNQPPQRDSDSPQSSDSPTLKDAPSGYAEVIRHDLDAERSHYRPNAPKLRRRSSSGETDDLRQFQAKLRNPQPESDDVFGVSGDTTPPHDPHNVVRVDTIQDSYNNNQQDGRPLAKIQLSDEPNVPLPKAIRKKTNLKRPNYVKSSRRVSFDPLALLLDASLEGELELVRRTATEVRSSY